MNRSDLSLCQLYDPQVIADPYPLYRRIQDEDPIHWDPFLHTWVVTRYDDVQTIQHTFSSVAVPPPDQLEALGCGALSPVARVLRKQMIFADGNAHARLRGMIARVFTPGYMKTLRNWIESRAERLAAEFAASGSTDLMRDFAEPLTTGLSALMLGIPESGHAALKRWSHDLSETLANFQLGPDSSDRISRTLDEASEYMRGVMLSLSRQPRESLTYALMAGEWEGSRLSEEEVIANCLFLMTASQETSAFLIGNAVVCFLRYPAELMRVQQDPALLPSAVEEVLRFESPSQYTVRVAPRDVELGGKTIGKGQSLISLIAAANRDPARFTDPDRFDAARTGNRHLAFGWGPHYCLGAGLARMEAAIGLSALLAKLGGLPFELDAPVSWQPSAGLRGPARLCVRLRRLANPVPAFQSAASMAHPGCPFHRRK